MSLCSSNSPIVKVVCSDLGVWMVPGHHGPWRRPIGGPPGGRVVPWGSGSSSSVGCHTGNTGFRPRPVTLIPSAVSDPVVGLSLVPGSVSSAARFHALWFCLNRTTASVFPFGVKAESPAGVQETRVYGRFSELSRQVLCVILLHGLLKLEFIFIGRSCYLLPFGSKHQVRPSQNLNSTGICSCPPSAIRLGQIRK